MTQKWKKKKKSKIKAKHAFNTKKFKPKFHQKKPSNSTYKKYRKYIAPIGIILLAATMVLSSYIPSEDIAISYSEDGLGSELVNSFIFPTSLDLAFTVILLFTLWFGYKSWLLRLRILRRNQKLVRNIMLAIILLIVATKIKVNSVLGIIADWILFLGLVAIMAFATLLLLRAINSINLRSDLNCWGLRIIGGILILAAFLLLVTSIFAMVIIPIKTVANNTFWIGSFCIMIIGAFCEYRSTRRHPMIGIWR